MIWSRLQEMNNVSNSGRLRTCGKFFRCGTEKWYAKGFCYGPFAANRDQEPFPEWDQVSTDFAHMERLGATSLRTYFPPPSWLLDAAVESNLRLLIDVPWEKHRCFFEDWTSQEEAREAVRRTAKSLGNHSAVFAISVANEIPNDVVRFYGHKRIARFLDELLDSVHQEAPECLATYANFPTTEFLQPSQQDFCCFNVYLHESKDLAAYLDRLQHLAGPMPLVLGEYGIDSMRNGEVEQASRLADFVEISLRHGAAGSFIFSYTDDWFTGGHQIEDWAFGVTRRDRSEKPAAQCMGAKWSNVPHTVLQRDHPKVSVIVCSYNAATTLEECLNSLMKVDYPDYEVILVDDGSTDDTPQIAARFPQVGYIRQANKGLSVARNIGLEAARGEIVAYTDADCVVDEDWLAYLVDAMHDQQVDAIGGPNLTPPTDSWTAKCVAASPGNPSHVMFDDRRAEHVPGCNMAFRRQTLVEIGGFDPQFRQAGDDVDICWRLLDAGYSIGFASAAMVWHHRRCSVKAFYRQQAGYGRAEAMLAFKHPQRFVAAGHARFGGVIYGDGRAGLPLLPARVYHGRFGASLFQCIYQATDYGVLARTTSLEWHFCATFLLLLSLIVPWLAGASLAMWVVTLGAVATTVHKSPLSDRAPWWCRLLVFWLHLSQPVVRGCHRNGYLLRKKRVPKTLNGKGAQAPAIRVISGATHECFWRTTNGQGRQELLAAVVAQARKQAWPGDFEGAWVPWDIELIADPWHHVTVRTVTEELGWPKRFTRARWAARPTRVTQAVVAGVIAWSTLAVVSGTAWALVAGILGCSLVCWKLVRSRSRCLHSAGRLIVDAAVEAQLAPRNVKEIVIMKEPDKSPQPAAAVVPTSAAYVLTRTDDSHVSKAFLDPDPSNA